MEKSNRRSRYALNPVRILQVLAVPTRDIPLAATRDALRARLTASVAANTGEPLTTEDKHALDKFVGVFDGARGGGGGGWGSNSV